MRSRGAWCRREEVAEQGGGLQIGPMGDWPVTGNLKGKQEISSQQVSHRLKTEISIHFCGRL